MSTNSRDKILKRAEHTNELEQRGANIINRPDPAS